METYNMGEFMQAMDPDQQYINEFRTAAADIISTIDINPYTQRMRDVEQMGNLNQFASPAQGMTGPMMGQMADPNMLPPEMMGQPMGMGMGMQDPMMQDPSQMGQTPMTDPMGGGAMNIQDPMGGMQAGLDNNPMMNGMI